MHSTNSLFGVSSTKPVTCWAWAIPEARPTYPTKLRLPLLRPTVPPRTSISSRIPSRYPQFRPPPTTASATNRNPRLIRLTPPAPHLPRLRVRCSCEDLSMVPRLAHPVIVNYSHTLSSATKSLRLLLPDAYHVVYYASFV